MNNEQLKAQIESFASQENCTFIDACSAMQRAAATLGNESIIEAIHNMKMQHLGLA